MYGLLRPRRTTAAEAMNEAEDSLPAIQPVPKNLHAKLLLAFLGIIDHIPAVPPTMVRKRKECTS
jgi:hypothetical protein